MIWIIVLQLFLTSSCEDTKSRVVHIFQGPVRGYMDPHVDIYAFYNIPYAKTPTGTNRFKAALPPPVWSDTFEAIDKEIVCPQSNLMNILPESKVIKVDCLIANVFIPKTNNTNLPVVVYVHGGGHFIGWGNMFTPKQLVKSKEIVAVTFNYRLGAHGFLCLGTNDIPGNAGMKDQVALLRWVKNNIASFGGNPDDIILSGFSTGASAVDILMLSKMTKGLFKKIIPESSANIAPFAVQLDPINNAKMYAKLLNFDNVENFYELENFYKTVSYDRLNSGQFHDRPDSVTLMAPCVERDIGEERILEDSPINILKSGNYIKYPMLYGFADMEGIFRMPQFNYWKEQMNDNFSNFLPADLQFKDENEKERLAKKIKQFYFGDSFIAEDTVLGYINYFSDILFAWPMLRSVALQIESGNHQIYLYQYSYVDDNIPTIPYTNVRGANHCAQTFAILDGFWNDTRIDENSVSDDMIKRKTFMKDIWFNFMTLGKPIPEGHHLPSWPPVGNNWSPYMSMNKTFELKTSLLKERGLFWQEIYDQYYRYPIAPTFSSK